MITTYSIAQARDQFTSLIRQAEQKMEPIQITRHGQPVAVILSAYEHKRLLAHHPQTDFWQAYTEWRDKWQIDEWEDDEDDPFADIRDTSSGRELTLWP